MSDEFDFLHVDKHESSLQIDTMIFGGDCQAFPKFSKQQMSLQYLKKEVKDEVDVSKLISILWVSKSPTR